MIKIHTILQESRSGEMSKSSSCWLLLRPEDSSRCRVFSWELRGLHRRCQRGSYQTKYLMKTLDKLIHRFPILSQRRNVWKCPSRFACKLRNRWKGSFIAHSKLLRSVLFLIIPFLLLDSSYFHFIHPPSFHRSQKPSFFAPGADPSVHGGGHGEGAHRLHGDRHRVQDWQEGPTETK